MITPETKLKFQIKSVLHLDGQYIAGKSLDDVVDGIYHAIFDKRNLDSLRYVLAEIDGVER